MTTRLLLLAIVAVFATVPAFAQYEASLVADVRPGPESAIRLAAPDRDFFSPTVYDGRLFFNADDGISGSELWAYDATSGEAALAADIWLGLESGFPTDFAVYDDRLFFAANHPVQGRELWAYDAATGEAILVADVNPDPVFTNSSPQDLTVYNGRLYFNAIGLEGGSRLWAYDAETELVTAIGDIAPDVWFFPFHLTVYDDRLFFSAEDYGNGIGRELWVYDAVTDALTLAADLTPGPSRSLGDDLHDRPVVYDNRLFLITYFGQTLWAYEAGMGEAALVADISASYLASYDGRLFFDGYSGQGGGTLWTYDGATETASPAEGAGNVSSPRALATYDGRLFFSALSELGLEAWAYDAGAADAFLVADLNPNGSSRPESFTVYDDRLFFSADDGEHGRELWVLSPTPVTNETVSLPPSVRLHAPHPNPAGNGANIAFEVADAGPVRVEVFDVLGRQVAVLTDGVVSAGEHALTWEAGLQPSGVYLVRLVAGDTVQTQRLTLAR